MWIKLLIAVFFETIGNGLSLKSFLGVGTDLGVVLKAWRNDGITLISPLPNQLLTWPQSRNSPVPYDFALYNALTHTPSGITVFLGTSSTVSVLANSNKLISLFSANLCLCIFLPEFSWNELNYWALVTNIHKNSENTTVVFVSTAFP